MRSNTRFLLSGKQVGIYYIDLLDNQETTRDNIGVQEADNFR